jgi:ubiquitin carboxyl-terminal hydrolase 6/32
MSCCEYNVRRTLPVIIDFLHVVCHCDHRNTCYLNASVQCLSHTPILREYFTSKAFLKDINRTNPLGHEGRLAQVSAVLINELWKRSHQSSVHQSKRATVPGLYSLVSHAPALTPKTFKESLGRFNELFAGNEQHDAQELLAFLLGGLSEDLNRIVEKPYMEAPDSDGRPDSELADIWWSNHLKREMSIVVALFTGQYKSLLTCRTCKYESARFEPFSFLQLPLPEDEHLSVSLTYYSAKEGVSAMKYCVRVRNDGNLRDVLIALAKILHQDELDERECDASVDREDPILSSTEFNYNAVYDRMVQNMTIVVMREGYIAKMASNSWLLQEQQNRESGELPSLHVYELDPLDTSAAATSIVTQDDTVDGDEKPMVSSPAFVAVAQRRSELVSRDFLHPLSHRVFGTPLLLRIGDIDEFTGRDLYDLVARRLKSVVPKPALRFLTPPTYSSGTDTKPSTQEKTDYVESAFRTTTDMEDVAAGPVPRYGFRLRLTTRDGRRCLRCVWYECCIGCLIPDDDDATIVGDGDSIVVDWHFAVDTATNGFGYRSGVGDLIFASQPVAARFRPPIATVKSHSSCGFGQKNGKQTGAVTLEECLDAFAKEEKIPEAYCSKCKDFRVQTKRMSLWRLPPVMIIHLKRFQFTPTMRRKLRDLVVFPTEGLDLSRIMAPDSSKGPNDEKQNGPKESSADELKDDGRSEMLYDLYGVIHHQGALSGGHYVASLKSEIDGQWRLFNDAQIYEIHARDVVDPSAYILFYIRRDVASARVSDYWHVQEGNPLSDEDMAHLSKGRSDRCVIS